MDKIILNKSDIISLREKVREYLTPKRYSHTLAVEREADRLGELFLPDDKIRLCAAALLHDITKKLCYEKQLQYCAEFGIMFSDVSSSAEVIHSVSGAVFAKKEFGEYVDDEIISAIRWHTTGRAGMTLFEEIIYLADFIEETRTFEGCRALRSYFWDRIKCGEDKFTVLTDTLIKSSDMSISHLLEKGSVIDINTVEARNSWLGKRSPFTNEVLL